MDVALLHPSPACTIWWLHGLLSLHCKNLSGSMCRTKLHLNLLCFLLGMGTVFASLLAGHLLEISLSLNGLHLRKSSQYVRASLTLTSLMVIPFRVACSLKAEVSTSSALMTLQSLCLWASDISLCTLERTNYFAFTKGTFGKTTHLEAISIFL